MLILTCMLYNTDSCEGPYRKKKQTKTKHKIIKKASSRSLYILKISS